MGPHGHVSPSERTLFTLGEGHSATSLELTSIFTEPVSTQSYILSKILGAWPFHVKVDNWYQAFTPQKLLAKEYFVFYSGEQSARPLAALTSFLG